MKSRSFLSATAHIQTVGSNYFFKQETMRLIITYILIIIPIYITVAQQNVYLKNNETGRQKKINRKTILMYKTSDSTWVSGRKIGVTDSSFSISTYEKNTEPDTVSIQIKSVSQVTKKLMNKTGLATTSYFFGTIGVIGLVTTPFLLISDPPEVAMGLLEASAVFIGVAGVLYSPYLIKRKFNTYNEWRLETK